MRASFLIVFLVIGIALSLTPSRGGSAEKIDPARVGELVAQLGNDRFQEREDAARALDALGEAALPALRKATSSEDLEVQRRARELVRKIERRLETARLLQPQRIRLVYKDTPLPEAVADFAKKSGFPLALSPTPKASDRKITLDTGEVPFWEAYEQFCAKAGLVEQAPDAGTGQDASTRDAEVRNHIRWLQARQLLDVKGYYAPSDQGGPVVLVEGKPVALPTYHAGAVRIRALPPNTAVPGQMKGEGEALLALEVMCDPRLAWQELISLRVHQAIDDNFRPMKESVPFLGGESHRTGGIEELIIVERINEWTGATPGGGSRRVPVRLKLPSRPSQQIKELHGTIAARVQGPVEPLMTIDNPLKAAGQSTNGPDGGFLKVIEAKREKNGQIKLRIQLKAPARNGGWDMGVFANRRAARLMIMNGGLAMAGGFTDLALLDAKGRQFQQVGANPTGANGEDLDLVFQPAERMMEPAKLVYTGRREAIIEVPFTLKDIPLAEKRR